MEEQSEPINAMLLADPYPGACPECGVPLTAWLNPKEAHKAGCSIGIADDARRVQDIEFMRYFGQDKMIRLLMQHERQLAAAIGMPRANLVRIVDARVYKLRIPQQHQPTAPFQWCRVAAKDEI